MHRQNRAFKHEKKSPVFSSTGNIIGVTWIPSANNGETSRLGHTSGVGQSRGKRQSKRLHVTRSCRLRFPTFPSDDKEAQKDPYMSIYISLSSNLKGAIGGNGRSRHLLLRFRPPYDHWVKLKQASSHSHGVQLSPSPLIYWVSNLGTPHLSKHCRFYVHFNHSDQS